MATTTHTGELLALLIELRPMAEERQPSSLPALDVHIAKLRMLRHRETCDGCQMYYKGEWRRHYEQRAPGRLTTVYDAQQCRLMTCHYCKRYGLDYVPFTRRGILGYSYRAFAVCGECGHAEEM